MLEHLRALREDSDLTQQDMANYLIIHQTTYSDYERGNLNIPLDVLIALAGYFKTSTDYLLGITDERKPYPQAKRK